MNEERPSLRCGEDLTGKEMMGAQSSLWASGTVSPGRQPSVGRPGCCGEASQTGVTT